MNFFENLMVKQSSLFKNFVKTNGQLVYGGKYDYYKRGKCINASQYQCGKKYKLKTQ